MKAIVFERYGTPDVLHLAEVDRPVPAADQALVEIRAASLNRGDWYFLTGRPFMVRVSPGGIREPKHKVLGGDVAGAVIAIGEDVTQIRVGDEIFADISDFGMGALAEYVAIDESLLTAKPANLSFQEAAAVPSAAVTALQGLRDHGGIHAGQRVAVNGASGGVGTYAVQIAKAFDTEVTAICSTSKMEMVRALGADYVVDYTQTDFTRGDDVYDLIVGVNGRQTMRDYARVLAPTGTYVCIGGPMRHIFGSMLLGPAMSREGGRQFKNMGSNRINKQDLVTMKGLVEAGKVAPVIDRVYPLAETADAFRYLGTKRARGKIVIAM